MRREMSPCIARRSSIESKAISERPMRHDNAGQGEFAAVLLRGLWFLVRLPVFMLLKILEPVAALVLGGLALAGILTTIFFVLIRAPHFPAWTMLTISVGFGLALLGYEALIRLFSR